MQLQQANSILSINCGSSSLTYCLYRRTTLEVIWYGAISRIGEAKGRLDIFDSGHQLLKGKDKPYKNISTAVNELIKYIDNDSNAFTIKAVGHRIVQGGPDHREPEVITDDLLQKLKDLIYLAPNHLPGEIDAINALKIKFPNLLQVACFDTAFHSNMPDYVKYYPLPRMLQTRGLMKYGFHGLSYQYIMEKLNDSDVTVNQSKIIIAHLGNGASMAAVNNGVSMDTTMGVSPIGGLVMSTRCGDMDPGVVVFLMKEYHLTAGELDDLLSKESGLKAMSGSSSVEELLKKEKNSHKAAFALKMFCYQAQKFIGAFAAAMGGLDRLVFTGGIGANSPQIRERICSGLGFMGIEIDKASNDKGLESISAVPAKVIVQAMQTNEELMIARLVSQVLHNK